LEKISGIASPSALSMVSPTPTKIPNPKTVKGYGIRPEAMLPSKKQTGESDQKT
jgi:hypothetical protein